MKKPILVLVLVCLLAAGVAIYAKPVHNVSGAKHPNLSEAQGLVDKAWNRIVAAQQANEFDMAGHAAKAKELLNEANKELKLAAEAANANKK